MYLVEYKQVGEETHQLPARRGRRAVAQVPVLYMARVDRSKYNPKKLGPVNFKGEPRR
jgi:hypothetical protein